MKSYYPEAAGRIQEKVEEECQLLDYEGSRLYDEYPDKFMLHQLCRQIRTQVEGETAAQGVPDSLMDDLIQVLLCQEISRRRCRRHRYYTTVHREDVSREVFWHEYAKIPRHTSQNSIAAGNLVHRFRNNYIIHLSVNPIAHV